MAERFIYPFKNQLFPFPTFIISYIPFQCSVLAQSKLILTCKYFFAKNPVVVVNNAEFIKRTIKFHDENAQLQINPEKLKCKIWIIRSLTIWECQDWSSWLSKIYKYNSYVSIHYSKMTYSELKHLAKKGSSHDFAFGDNEISDGPIDMVKVLELFPGAQAYDL